MEELNKSVDLLIKTLMETEIYRQYTEQEQKLMENTELKERVDQFRKNNYRLQQQAEKEDLPMILEQLYAESRELRKDPQVNAYLDAELALCKLMQKIFLRVTDEMRMHIPEL
ncbi:MAG: YlbF family regulator [Blautia sp.]|nr:YlbF family regulator [Blautia sp.]MDY5031222.1 YlbF family regulator [Blautia sp.]